MRRWPAQVMTAEELAPDPVLQMAIALLDGATLPAFLCSREPRSLADVKVCSIGHGSIEQGGGEFTFTRNGTVKAIAVEFEGGLVVTHPGNGGMNGVRGGKARVGTITFASPAAN